MRVVAAGALAIGLSAGLVPATRAQDGSWITYRLSPDPIVYRIAAQSGALADDISNVLDGVTAPADDAWLNVSPDGRWLLLETERWGCVGWACLARVRADGTEGEAIVIGGQVVHPEGFGAISSDGATLVWPGEGCGAHGRDLWISFLVAGEWSPAVCLSESSSGNWNHEPALSADGEEVVFSCGDELCRIRVDGSDLVTEVTLADHPGVGDWIQIKSPDLDPDGNLVFEGEAEAEQIWRKDPSSGAITLVNPSMNNDNSPCVLPDGRIASLWLDRPGNPTGVHELKVMDRDGSNDLMLVTFPADVFDIGIGCAGFAGAIFADGFESGDLSRWSSAQPVVGILTSKQEPPSVPGLHDTSPP